MITFGYHATGRIPMWQRAATLVTIAALALLGFCTQAEAAAPTFTSLSVTTGSASGGTPTVLTGTNFTGATGVTFGGAAGTAFAVVNATTINVTIPAGTGAVSVVVLSPAGNATLAAGFTYAAAPAVPTITSLSVTTGSASGGTPTVLTGTNFTGATGVTFGGAAGTAFSVINATTINVTTPAGTGAVSVVILHPAGNATRASGFTYTAAPAVPTFTSLSVTTGSASGGTPTVLTGTNFTGATGVTFGGVGGTAFSVVNATTINVTTPAGTGAVSVVVLHPSGNATLAAGFTYTAVPGAPTLTSLSVATGPASGGTPTVLTGTNFTGATGVTFGGVAGTAFSVVNATTINVTTPPGTGAVSVVVLHPSGNATLAAGFTYTAVPGAPTLTSLSVATGPASGGTPTVLTGTNFTGATGVTFGGVAGTAFSVVNATTINVTTPPGTGAVSVVVLHPSGNATLAAGFTYTAVPGAPTLTSLSVATGPASGGTPTVLTGTNFTGATGVTFGGVAGTAFSVVNATTINVTTPAGTGAVSIVVLHPSGNATLAAGFTYTALPTITPTVTSLLIAGGPAAGGTQTVLTGINFTCATGVTFGGIAGTGFAVVTDTAITVATPPGTGIVDVVVLCPGGNGTLPGSFTYTATVSTGAPTITGLLITTGPATGGTPTVLNGVGFAGATGVNFGGVAGTTFAIISDTAITVITPPGTGTVDVVVLSAAGNGTLAGGFTYTPSVPTTVPTIASLSATTGPAAGGSVIFLTGTNFTGATGVNFGGVSGTSFAVVDDTTISITTPAGTGTVDVVMLHLAGNVTVAGGFTYAAASASATGVFLAAPTFSPNGLALAVFGGGSVDQLEMATLAASATGVWVQDGSGSFQLLIANGPSFLKDAFKARFANGVSGPIAVTLTSSSPAATTTSTPAAAAVSQGTRGSTPTTYVVTDADLLSGIAARFGVSWPRLAQANGIQEPNYLLQLRQVLTIPLP